MHSPMRTSPRRCLLAAVAFSSSILASHAFGAGMPNDVVVRVGDRTVTAGELERRIASIPPFQLKTLGRSADEVRKNFVEQGVVRELLLSEGGAAAKLDARPEVRERIRGLLRGALIARTRGEAAATASITEANVKGFYDRNVAKYNAPPRIAIWRILVGTREDAARVLEEIKKDPKSAHWNDIAREKSIDKATNMRGGALGFVAPDGSTAEPGVVVDLAVLRAAASVADGEFAPEPVREGKGWAVVWRRQSMKAVVRTIEQETPAIRQTIAHERGEAKVKELVERLRRERVSALNEAAVDQLEITSAGDVQRSGRPGVLPQSRHSAQESPVPMPGPSGLR